MTENRTERLISRLEKGRGKTLEVMNSLGVEQWNLIVYPDPAWTVRHLLAHFVSAERQLLSLAQSIASGGAGAPPDLDINRFNAAELQRMDDLTPQTLLTLLDQARRETITWVATLDAAELNAVGRHPVLGEINVEIWVEAIYSHQLLHMRDLMRLLQAVV